MMPAFGHIVRYKGRDGDWEPAVVTRVHSEHCVSLHVLPFDGPARPVTSVLQLGQGGDRSWTWLEKD
jgi:hypothetical protein